MTALIIEDNSIAQAIIEKLSFEMDNLKIGEPKTDTQNKEKVFVFVTADTGTYKPPVNDDCVFFRDNSVIRRMNTNDILYVEAMGDYVKLHTPQKTYIVHCTLKATEQRLPASNFIKVHRSFIIALNKLDSIQDGGLVIRGRFIPVADNLRKNLNQRMNIL